MTQQTAIIIANIVMPILIFVMAYLDERNNG